MNYNIYNHDRLNTFLACKKKYYYKYVRQMKFPEFEDCYRTGKSLHALIDYHLKEFETDHLFQTTGDKELDKIKKLYERIKTDQIFRFKSVASEWGFSAGLRIQNNALVKVYRLVGRIDAIFFDEESQKYIIADWKTGIFSPKKSNIENNFQHKVYLWAFYQAQNDLNLNFTPEELSFCYFKIEEDFVIPTEIPFDSKKLLQYENEFTQIIAEAEKLHDSEKSLILADAPSCKACGDKNCFFDFAD